MSLASTSARLSRSNSTTPACPLSAAHMRGVLLYWWAEEGRGGRGGLRGGVKGAGGGGQGATRGCEGGDAGPRGRPGRHREGAVG